MMAFSGLPSKSCANCRRRRIKCNLAEPECAQCRRAGKECPGYRDRLALLFRDENEKVIRKATGRPLLIGSHESKSVNDKLLDIGTQVLKLDSSPTTIPYSNWLSVVLRLGSQAVSPSIPVSPSASPFRDDPGILFFFQHYTTPAIRAPRGQLSIPSPHSSWGESRMRHLVDAISCVGLAGLANVNNDPEVMAIARQKYGITLQRVAAALKAPRYVDIGYALKATTMLSLFELVDLDLSSVQRWGVHLDGAAALMTSNWFLQYFTNNRGKLDHQFFYAMLIKHIHSGHKFPTFLANWARKFAQSTAIDSSVTTLTEIMIKFVDLNADVRLGIPIETDRVLREALHLNHALEDWKKALPPALNYKTFQGSQTLDAYDGQYHIYSHLWIAQLWDNYRWIRILVHELILTQLSSLPLETCDQKSKSLRMISDIASEVCVSVSSQLYPLNDYILGDSSKAELHGAFMLIWPLEIAGGAIGVSEAMHNWILDTVGKIGQRTGIRAADLIKSKAMGRRMKWKSTGAYDSEE